MFIRRFLTVSCIASVIVGLVILLEGKAVDLKYNDFFNDIKILENISDDNYFWENNEDIDINDANNHKLNFYNEKNDAEVLLELYIPRISLRKFVYNMNSSKNNVDLNVEILDDSNRDINLYFLAAHSGGGKASYFDELVYLESGDIIWIYIDNYSLGYVVDEIFYIEKNGYFSVSYGSNGNKLFLITCSLEHQNMQFVVSAKLVYTS